MKVLDSAVMPVVVTESGPSPSLRIHAKGRTQMIQNPRSMSTKISNVFRNEGFMFLAERLAHQPLTRIQDSSEAVEHF